MAIHHKCADFGVLNGKRETNEPGNDTTVKYLSIDKIDKINPLDSKLKYWMKTDNLHIGMFKNSIKIRK
jgi:hypothetical protein